MFSVFLAHAPADAPFAGELSAFLEAGCDNICFAKDAAMRAGEDIVAAAETGRSADVLVLLLSGASNPERWVRERWEAVLSDGASGGDTRIAIFLLEECAFPRLLRRGLNFFDATAERLPAMRRLKRWLWGIQCGTPPGMTFSPDLEDLYRALADRPGICTAPGAMADRFAHQAARDFEAVFWISAHGRNLTRIAGELGAQAGMRLDGPAEDNCRRIRDVLSRKRCLLILDAPEVAVDPIMPGGRTSVLSTSEPVRVVEEDARSLAAGRCLVSSGRFAEAYEIFQGLFSAGIETESCARELVWICDHWDCIEEANAFRFHVGRAPSEQLRLF